MTDDVTRGLTMLADEAEPAPIDSHDVIARARARTRTRRTTVAAAFATVAVIGALAVTVGNPGTSSKPATTTTVATTPESLTDQLTRQLTEALPDLIPNEWKPVAEHPPEAPPLTFRCLGSGCDAHAAYTDGAGKIDLRFQVDNIPRYGDSCEEHCTRVAGPVRAELPDGTRTQVSVYTENLTSHEVQQLLASRPDGTQVSMSVTWPQGQRGATPLTTDEIVKFATLFTYDPVLDAAPTTKTQYVTEDPTRPARLNDELTDVLAEVVPAEWSQANEGHEADEPPLTFDCRLTSWSPSASREEERPKSEGCWTYGYYRDGTGKIGFKFSVSRESLVYDSMCRENPCVRLTLPDGTETRRGTTTQPGPTGDYTQEVSAVRPDGTSIWVEVFWTDQRSTTPITAEQLLKFAEAFTF